jgi:uncharacterized damage-inducible protein DinB
MGDVDDHGRPEPPLRGDEAATLLGFLDYQRATLAWKTAGLEGAGLQARVAVSSMSLGGLLKHMAIVEDHWCSHSLLDRPYRPEWADIDWDADPDWEWRTSADQKPDELRRTWQQAVARSRTAVAEVLAEGGLDTPARRTWADGRAPSLRWILCHLVEEYARHNGHADLLREAIDGETGE